jgi:hypothetical protein
MPTRKDPCIKLLIADIESKKLHIRKTATQILDLYPDIKKENERCEKFARNWSSFWCGIRREYLNKGWLEGNQGEPPPEPDPNSLPPARKRVPVSSPAATPAPSSTDESPLVEESQIPAAVAESSLNLSQAFVMESTQTQTQTEKLAQTSKQNVFLELGAEKWYDFNRNKHLSILTHLPAGADTDNTDANVHTGGNYLDIEWDSPDIFQNPNFLQSYLQGHYNVDGSKFPYKIDSFREACRQRCKTGIGKKVSRYSFVKPMLSCCAHLAFGCLL